MALSKVKKHSHTDLSEAINLLSTALVWTCFPMWRCAQGWQIQHKTCEIPVFFGEVAGDQREYLREADLEGIPT